MGKHTVSKRYLIFIAIIIVWTVLYLAGHNRYVSDHLKGMVIEKSEAYLKQDVSIDTIHINLIPLFVELQGVSIENEREKWLKARRIKIYIDLMELFIKKISVRRVLIQEADISLRKDSVAVAGVVGRGGGGKSSFSVRNVDLRNSRVSYEDSNIKVKGSNVNVSAFLTDEPEFHFDVGEFDIGSKVISASNVSARGRVQIKGRVLAVSSLRLASGGSTLDLKGKLYPDTKELNVDAKSEVDVGELSRMLGLDVVKKGKIETSGKIRYMKEGLFVKTNVSGRFFLESLMSIFRVKAPLRGLTEFEGELNVEKGEITGSASAVMKKGHIYGVDIDRIVCDVSYSDHKLSFRNGSAKLYGGKGTAEVYITLPRITRYMVDVEVEDVNARDMLGLINFDVDISKGRVTGRMRSEGDRFQPEGWFRARFDNEEGDILKRLDSAEGSFHSKGSTMFLKDLLIRNEKTNAIVNGAIDLKSHTMALQGHLNTSGISDIVFPYEKKIDGSGSAIFSVDGTLGHPVIKGGIMASDVFYGGLYYKEAESTFRYEQELLKIHDLSLRFRDETDVISGSIAFKNTKHLFDLGDPEFALSARIRNMDVKRVLNEYGYSLPIDGIVTSTLELDGPLHDLQAKAIISATRVSAYNVLIDAVTTEVMFARGAFLFRDLVISRGESIVSGELDIDLKGNYTFRTDSVKIHIGQIPVDLDLEKGVLDMELSGKGSLKHPHITSKLKISDVTAEGVPIGYGDLEIELRDDEITASGSLFDGKTDVKAVMKLGKELMWELDAQFSRGVYDFVAAYLIKDIPEDLILNLEGHLRMFGTGHDYSGRLNMSSFNLSMHGMNFKNSSDISIGIERRKISFEKVNLTSGTASFSIEGSLVPFEKYDLALHGDSSLDVLKDVATSVNDVKGYGSFVFAVRGAWKDPVIDGGISLRNSSVGIKGLMYRIVNINSYIYVDRNRIVVDSLTGNFGGGKIRARGFGRLKELGIEEFNIDVGLEDSTVRVSRGIFVNFDGELILQGQRGSSNIVGQVTIKRARYTHRVDWKSRLVKAGKVEKPRGSLSSFEKTGLNIKITGSKDITINNNIAKATLKVELLLRGTVADPILFGRVETDEGTVYFRNNEFEIVHASADFIDSDRINPYFDITAETSVKGYDIRIVIEGKMPELDLSLTSDPPLDETDILGLLTVGEIGSNLAGMEEGIGTAEATSFLTGKYQDVLEERMTMLTGLDRFQVEPYFAEETGQIGPRVTASKRLIEDKLFVSYSSSVGYSEGDVIKLEYKLNKSVSLIGVQDELGSLGGDIIFRFDFK